MFGLHTPHSPLAGRDHDQMRGELTDAVLASLLNSVLAEPIQDLLFTDADGNPCVRPRPPLDLENTLRMTAGNIFHGALAAVRRGRAALDTPLSAGVWRPPTPNYVVRLRGSAAARSNRGIGGHNAAMAVLEAAERG